MTRVLLVGSNRDRHAKLLAAMLPYDIHVSRADLARAVPVALRVKRPDVAVIDLLLPDGYGIDVAKRLLQFAPKVRVLIESKEYTPAIAYECLTAGCYGLVKSPSRAKSLHRAIETVTAGDRYYLDEHIQAAALIGAGVAPELALTARDCTLIHLLRQKLSYRQIANRLGTTEIDIKNACQRLKHKLRDYRP